MATESGELRRIAWRELFPWLILLRTFWLAIAPSALLMAALGVLVGNLGWQIAPYLFFSSEGRQQAHFDARVWANGNLPALSMAGHPDTLEAHIPPLVASWLPRETSALVQPFLALAEPIRRLLRYETSLNETAYYLFGALWSLAVWAFVGGYLTRRSVLELGREQPADVVEVCQFAVHRYPWYFLSPLYPLLGVAVLALLFIPVGWLMRLDVGFFIVAIGWFLAIFAGLAATWLLTGLLFGWPLMWCVLSSEREGDPFEAFSRSYSYVYGKPLHYLFYVVVAAAFGALCYTVVNSAGQMVVEFGFWAASWGAGGARMGQIHDLVYLPAANPASASSTLRTGASIMTFWIGLVDIVVRGFAYSFFWSAAAAIYLLLRKDVDDKEMDDVYRDDDQPAVSLPAAKPAGKPAAAAPAPPAE